ncbi:prolyl hydroxylase family protein [Paraglaciecola sp. 2405UD69-4]|uniref:prolyl hydroxylase family protein n=1 Tax=Paraglaciecola sp. 2405UD69-4 TaxID=3391836 RepID=UPI0039C9A6C2
MSLLRLLEDKHFNRLTNEKIFALAETNQSFCQQWLIHVFRSESSVEELFMAVAYCLKHNSPILEQLNLIFSGQTFEALPEDVYQEALNLVVKNLPSVNRDKVLRSALPLLAFVHYCPVLEALSQDIRFGASQIDIDVFTNIKTQFDQNLQKVTLFGSQGQGSRDSSIRNNSQYFASIPNDNVSLALVERALANSSGISIRHAEPPVILRYLPGQFYHWHYDYIYPHTADIERQINQFGQRIKTGIYYLNDDFTGGETEFKTPHVSIPPKKNHMLIFDNASQGKPIKNSIHRGAEVASGEKWIMTLWFRDKPFWLRSGLMSY